MTLCICTILIGTPLGVWTGGYACPGEKVALLACVATGGFHSVAKYAWKRDDHVIAGEDYPILYATCRGKYACMCMLPEEHVFTFEVEGN